VAVPLPGGRRLEPQSGGLGCGRGGVGLDRGGSGAASLSQGELPPANFIVGEQCQQSPLILHADNGNAMRGARLESRLKEMGVLRSFSRPRVSTDNPYSESLFRTVKYRPERPDYPSRPFASKDQACE
jgi:transposase InsO family protein